MTKGATEASIYMAHHGLSGCTATTGVRAFKRSQLSSELGGTRLAWQRGYMAEMAILKRASARGIVFPFRLFQPAQSGDGGDTPVESVSSHAGCPKPCCRIT